MNFIFVLRRLNWFSSQCNVQIVVYILCIGYLLFSDGHLYRSVPLEERSRAVALVFGGLSIGSVLGYDLLFLWMFDVMIYTSFLLQYFWNAWEHVILFGSALKLSLIFYPFHYVIGMVYFADFYWLLPWFRTLVGNLFSIYLAFLV